MSFLSCTELYFLVNLEVWGGERKVPTYF